jgi:hypothetical protein
MRAISLPMNSSWREIRSHVKQKKMQITDHSPISPAPTNIENKSTDDCLSTNRVRHFRMKLDAVIGFRIMSYGSKRSRIRLADNVEIRRHFR